MSSNNLILKKAWLDESQLVVFVSGKRIQRFTFSSIVLFCGKFGTSSYLSSLKLSWSDNRLKMYNVFIAILLLIRKSKNLCLFKREYCLNGLLLKRSRCSNFVGSNVHYVWNKPFKCNQTLAFWDHPLAPFKALVSLAIIFFFTGHSFFCNLSLNNILFYR